MVQNANKWASEGWGGYAFPAVATSAINVIVMMTPKLTLEEAQASMEPLSNFAIGKNLTRLSTALPLATSVSTIPSFYEFFTGSGGALQNANGGGAALSSRLVPSKYFESENQDATIDALYDIIEASIVNTDPILPLFICITGPSNYAVPESDQPGGPGASAVTPAWRSSPWHVIHTGSWDPTDPTTGGTGSVNAIFAAAHNAMNPLRKLTPDGGAYQNEADTFEPDPAGSFWGMDNYERLMGLKKEMDPGNLLTVHQGIGWDSGDERWGCYPEDPNGS